MFYRFVYAEGDAFIFYTRVCGLRRYGEVKLLECYWAQSKDYAVTSYVDRHYLMDQRTQYVSLLNRTSLVLYLPIDAIA